MNAQAQAPNLTSTAPLTTEQVMALDPTEALRRIASGDCLFTAERNNASHALKVARSSGTGLLLATAKRFASLDALATADNSARASVPANVKIDPTYRTGMDYMRAAAGSLGWQALLDATTIGSLYKAHTDKKRAASKASGQEKPDVMPAPVATGSAQAAVVGQWNALQDALSGLPDDVVIGILADAMSAAMAAKLQEAM